jgi:CBS-domain-containing membrane protein
MSSVVRASAGHMNTERIEVATEFSDAQIAQTFLHHRVLIVPVVDAERRVLGVMTRSDFFRAAPRAFWLPADGCAARPNCAGHGRRALTLATEDLRNGFEPATSCMPGE